MDKRATGTLMRMLASARAGDYRTAEPGGGWSGWGTISGGDVWVAGWRGSGTSAGEASGAGTGAGSGAATAVAAAFGPAAAMGARLMAAGVRLGLGGLMTGDAGAGTVLSGLCFLGGCCWTEAVKAEPVAAVATGT